MKGLIVLFSILVYHLPVLAQKEGPVYSSTNKKAIRYFEEGQIHYKNFKTDDAISSLEKAIAEDSLFIEAYVMLAEAWNDKQDPYKTISYYKQAFRINPSFYPLNYLFAGVLEHSVGEYQDAKLHLEQFLKYPNATRDPRKMELAEFTLRQAEFAIVAIKNPVPFNPQNLGPAINTELNEYFPAITADDQRLLFTRRVNDDRVRGGQQEDFFMSVKDKGGNWDKAQNMGMPINTPANEGAPTLSADGQIIIFTACEIGPGVYGPRRQGMGSCDLFYTRSTGTAWSEPVNLGPPINSTAWETQPSYSADGRSLYFVRGSSRGTDKQGDIYYAYVSDQGTWTTPVKLGPNINTDREEQSVFIHPDGQTLYFSSEGHVGMGGFDIFVSKKLEDGIWGPAANLGYPINTSGDENSLMVSGDGRIGYFASDRQGGMGGLDLYSFDLPESLRPKSISYLKGILFDADTKAPLAAKFELIDLQTEKVVVQSFSSAGTGEFLVVLPAGKNYALNVSADGYLFHSENFEMVAGTENKPQTLEVPLSKIKAGESVVLRNVFFNSASAELRDESRAELNKLVAFLKGNPAMKIELSGHTDDVGDDSSNKVLSENRAKAVHQYLIEKGISAERLTFKGYGETQPIAPNTSEEGRQKNRRTEFRVISLN